MLSASLRAGITIATRFDTGGGSQSLDSLNLQNIPRPKIKYSQIATVHPAKMSRITVH